MEIFEALFIGIVCPVVILFFSSLYSSALARASRKYEIKIQRYDIIHDYIGQLIILMESLIDFHDEIEKAETIDEKTRYTMTFLKLELEENPSETQSLDEHLDELGTTNAIFAEGGVDATKKLWIEKAEILLYEYKSGKISRISRDYFKRISAIQLITSSQNIDKLSVRFIQELLDFSSSISRKFSEDQPIIAEDRERIKYHTKNFKTLREKMILDLEETLKLKYMFSKPEYATIFLISAWIVSMILFFIFGIIFISRS